MKLSPKKIIDNKFESIINGYSPMMVDQFLDDVVEDYKEMIKIISDLKDENEELKNKIIELEKSLANIEVNNDEQQS